MFFVSGCFPSVLGGERLGYIFWIRTINGGITRCHYIGCAKTDQHLSTEIDPGAGGFAGLENF